ncbi:MAG: hypothetical protein N3J91_14195 [Verrucomicrobiae bacterium]|nr:hypothetical protein [Verrucomicrobiae bacterium]
MRRSGHWVGLLLLAGMVGLPLRAAGAVESYYVKRAGWVETMAASRARLAEAALPEAQRRQASRALWLQVERDFPMEWDWTLQDAGVDFADWFVRPAGERERKMVERVLAELGPAGRALQEKYAQLNQRGKAAGAEEWLALYRQAAEARRAVRLQTLMREAPAVVFTRRRTIRPSFFAYTEGQSDAQHERHFLPGAALCLLEMDGLYGRVRVLLADEGGVIRDPEVSFDGRKILFAWKKHLNEDDYHLYEMSLPEGQVRQLTAGAGCADYEPAYLPNGDIIFSSTRCVQTVDCFWTEVSNLYTCDANGQFIRRLGVDQVHTVFPTVTEDGRVLYTRWDYNDRGQIFPQALFQMNPDGTGQTEFYGNNSWFPTVITHARQIPGTQKVLAILCGHHSPQTGKLAIIDPARGRQENAGVTLIAPERVTRAERIDAYGQEGELFQHPYPLNENEYLVSYAPLGWSHDQGRGDAHFSLYYMDRAGRREWLAGDVRCAVQHPVPLRPRRRPVVQPARVDYRKTNAVFYLQDVYAGPGLAGVPRGTIEQLRVVALEFRAAGIGENHSGGPGGGALISTPIAIGNGSWDVKRVLGQARVHADGSAAFYVPARTPVYFQALDARGFVVQTMRSWSTLQPGEVASCVGCHEHKNTAPPVTRPTLAQRAGPEELRPFYGPPRGFSFTREIQPILDRHCIRCHHRSEEMMPGARWLGEGVVARRADEASTNAFSLLSRAVTDPVARRHWSEAYLNLTQSFQEREGNRPGPYRGQPEGRLVSWISSQSVPSPLPPYAAGAARSQLMGLLQQGHYGVALTREEWDKLACWIDLLVPFAGDYVEANAWTPQEKAKYEHFLNKRRRLEAEERESVARWLGRLPGGS